MAGALEAAAEITPRGSEDVNRADAAPRSWSRGCDGGCGGLIIPNEGTTARDHLARERNFLSSLKACVSAANDRV